MIVCEICGAAGDEADAIMFPSSQLMRLSAIDLESDDPPFSSDEVSPTAMVHGACCRIEVESGNMRIIDDRIIESLQLYCTHFGQNAMPNKIGDDENA